MKKSNKDSEWERLVDALLETMNKLTYDNQRLIKEKGDEDRFPFLYENNQKLRKENEELKEKTTLGIHKAAQTTLNVAKWHEMQSEIEEQQRLIHSLRFHIKGRDEEKERAQNKMDEICQELKIEQTLNPDPWTLIWNLSRANDELTGLAMESWRDKRDRMEGKHRGLPEDKEAAKNKWNQQSCKKEDMCPLYLDFRYISKKYGGL